MQHPDEEIDLAGRQALEIARKHLAMKATGHPEFYRIIEEMKALHEKKAADYGTGQDPLHNVRSGGEFVNIPGWQAAMLRVNDKMVRLRSLIKNGKLANEGAEDSLLDIANYAVLALILYREVSKA